MKLKAKSLTASIPVIPCTTYHLKFAIADRGDTALDSGVYIGELKGDVPVEFRKVIGPVTVKETQPQAL